MKSPMSRNAWLIRSPRSPRPLVSPPAARICGAGRVAAAQVLARQAAVEVHVGATTAVVGAAAGRVPLGAAAVAAGAGTVTTTVAVVGADDVPTKPHAPRAAHEARAIPRRRRGITSLILAYRPARGVRR